MRREQVRNWLFIVGLALLMTVFFNASAAIVDAVFGILGLIFICLLWYFGYTWYRNNRTAISLMPDRQRNAMYAGMGCVTVAAGAYSLGRFGLIDLGAFAVPLLLLFLGGVFAMFWAWQESKRYYL
jgi:hypothetical protein